MVNEGGWKNRRTDGRTDGWIDRWMKGWMKGWTDGRTDGRTDVWKFPRVLQGIGLWAAAQKVFDLMVSKDVLNYSLMSAQRWSITPKKCENCCISVGLLYPRIASPSR